MNKNKNSGQKRQMPLFEPDSVPDYRETSFVTSPCNAALLEVMEQWALSDEAMLLIHGQAGSGKTHLAHILKMRLLEKTSADNIYYACGVQAANEWASKITANQALHEDHGSTQDYTLIVDDVVGGDLSVSPRQILDLIEDCRSTFIRLVLIGQGNPIDWAQGLKDLMTRLEAMARITMVEPDEALMRTVIGRHLQARQLALLPDEITVLANYAAPRLGRTFEAASEFCKRLDVLALSEKKKPTRNLARIVIDEMT